jgi:hypothetical protein
MVAKQLWDEILIKKNVHKEGRNWLSSKKTLDDYLTNRERQRGNSRK